MRSAFLQRLFPLLLASAPLPAAADGIETDRPDFTETSVVVPRHSFQLESGFTWEHGSGVKTFSGPEALLRYGWRSRTEFRLGLPDYVRASNGRTRSGFADTYLGLKQQLGPLGGWDLSLIPAVTVPTGSGGFGTGSIDPEVVATWARDLGGPWSIGGGFGFFWTREDGSRPMTFLTTVAVGRDLGGRWGSFFEWAAEFPNGGGDVHLLHHGYTYALTSTSQADLHFGFGISRAAPDFFIGAGFSRRF